MPDFDKGETDARSSANTNGGSSGQIVGEREGTAFPFRFRRGNGVPLAYTTAVGGRWGMVS